MVSSISVPMPARAQAADSAAKGTGSTGDRFQEALQKTIQVQRTEAAGQDKTETGKETGTEELKPDQAGKTEENTEKPETGMQHAQILVIPGQENLVLLLNQGLAEVSGQAETAMPEAGVPVQTENMPAITAAGQELQTALTGQAAVQDTGKTAEAQALSGAEEISGQKLAGQLKTAETVFPAQTAAKKAQPQDTAIQDDGRAAEAKQSEPVNVKLASRQEKRSGTERTAAGENGGVSRVWQEQPQSHLAAQAIGPQEHSQMPQAVNNGPAESVFRPSQAETLPQELPAKLAESISRGGREFTISLEPESLGKMMIKASFEGGKAMVSITCSSAKTLELLSTHAKDMGAIMESHMGTPTNVVVEKSQPDYLAQQQQQGGQNQQPEEQKKQENSGRKQEENGESFLQQLRLGLV